MRISGTNQLFLFDIAVYMPKHYLIDDKMLSN